MTQCIVEFDGGKVMKAKGMMDSMNLKLIEIAKIDCAKKLFNEIATDGVKHSHVKDYKDLLDVMKLI